MVDAHDAQLVAALTLLRDHLGPVVDELLAGELDEADRAELARALHLVADELVPVIESDQPRRPFSSSGA